MINTSFFNSHETSLKESNNVSNYAFVISRRKYSENKFRKKHSRKREFAEIKALFIRHFDICLFSGAKWRYGFPSQLSTKAAISPALVVAECINGEKENKDMVIDSELKRNYIAAL